jgi:hypothetical protein
MAGQALYEVRSGESIVGPVSLDQIRRGRAGGKVPYSAEARAVGPWMTVDRVSEPTETTSAAWLQHASFQVRHANNVVGPVSFYQLRRGLAAGRIPAGSEARWVGPWALVAGLLSTLGRSLPPQRQRTSGPAPPPQADEDDEGPTLHRPASAEPSSPPAARPASRPRPAPEPPLAPRISAPPVASRPPAAGGAIPSTPPVASRPPAGDRGLTSTTPIAQRPPASDEFVVPHRGLPRLRLFATGALLVLALACTGFGVVRCVLVRSAPQRAQNLLLKADATGDAATAIHLYAESIRARTQYAEVAPEALAETRSRIQAKARRRVDDLLSARRADEATRFVAQIRPDVHAAGLDPVADELDRAIAGRGR